MHVHVKTHVANPMHIIILYYKLMLQTHFMHMLNPMYSCQQQCILSSFMHFKMQETLYLSRCTYI